MKTEFLKVKDNPDLIRERSSKAVLNTNKGELNKYRQVREEKIKLKSLMEDQERMKSDIEEIKSLLKQLIGQNK
jgi:hypothetical protein